MNNKGEIDLQVVVAPNSWSNRNLYSVQISLCGGKMPRVAILSKGDLVGLIKEDVVRRVSRIGCAKQARL
jgi:hypothetical protein